MFEDKAMMDVPGNVIRNPTIREQLEREKQRTEEQLAAVNTALKALDKNPGFEEVHNAIVRARIGGLR